MVLSNMMKILSAISKFFFVLLLFNFGCNNMINDGNISPKPSPTKSIEPAKTSESSPYPSNWGSTGQVTQRFVVNGFVYDNDKNPLSGVNVSIKFLNNQDKQGVYSTEYTTDTTGMYFFRGIPDNTDVEISSSKPGYKTVIRKENINSNKFLDPYYKINFGGDGEDAKYVLEKIN